MACVKLSEGGQPILLANRINKKDVMIIYRVPDLEAAASELHARGWRQENKLEIPPGPCCTFLDPADNVIVIYENLPPDVMKDFAVWIDSD